MPCCTVNSTLWLILVADDLIIFPDDCEFKKVDQCKDGRVYVLKFKSSNRKLFFWSQEPSTDKDEEYCRKVNDLLNNTSSSGGSSGGREGSDVQYLLNNMSQQQLMSLFNAPIGDLSSLLGTINRSGTSSSNRTATTTPLTRGAAAAAAATAVQTPANATQPATPKAPKKEKSSDGSSSEPTSDSSRVLLSELQNYLSGINTGASGAPKHHVDLTTAINSSTNFDSILNDPERLDRLSEHLPAIDEDGKSLDAFSKKQQLKDTLASAQFQQALSMFSTALQSGQMGPVVSQFKLGDDAVSAAFSGNLELFVKALEKTAAKTDDEKKEESKN